MLTKDSKRECVVEKCNTMDGMINPLDKIRRCVCNMFPALYGQNTWKFDYGRMESGGCVKRSFQFCCEGCTCRTPEFNSVSEALSYWNQMSEKGFFLKRVREGDGCGL